MIDPTECRTVFTRGRLRNRVTDMPKGYKKQASKPVDCCGTRADHFHGKCTLVMTRKQEGLANGGSPNMMEAPPEV